MSVQTGGVALWIDIERTKSPVLFRVSLKIGNGAFSKPKVLSSMQVIGLMAKQLNDLTMAPVTDDTSPPR